MLSYLREGLCETFVLLSNLRHELFLLDLPLAHLGGVCLQRLDQVQVIVGDVVVVILDVRKCLHGQ